MSYKILSPGQPGTAGVYPQLIPMESTDTLEVITTPGYLNSASNLGIDFTQPTFILMTYSGGGGLFLVSISGGVITLTQKISGSGLLTTPNDFAVFGNTSGEIVDNGYSPSNPAYKIVSMVSPGVSPPPNPSFIPVFTDDRGTIGGSIYRPSSVNYQYMCMQENIPVVGHIPTYYDVNGTLTDTGKIPSNASLTNISMAQTPITVGAYAVFTDAAGTIGVGPAVGAFNYSQVNLLDNYSFSSTDGTVTIPFDNVLFDNQGTTLVAGAAVLPATGIYQIMVQVQCFLTTDVLGIGPNTAFSVLHNSTPITGSNIVQSQSTLTSFGNNALMQSVVSATVGDTISMTAVINLEEATASTAEVLGNIYTSIIILRIG